MSTSKSRPSMVDPASSIRGAAILQKAEVERIDTWNDKTGTPKNPETPTVVLAMAPIVFNFVAPTSLSVGIANEPTIITTNATHAVDSERSIDQTGPHFRYVPRCNEDEDDNCPPRSSSSFKSSSTIALPGPTSNDAVFAARTSHSTVVIALATVLGIVLFSIAAFLVWRLRPHPPSAPRGDIRAGRGLRTQSPMSTTIRRGHCHVEDAPPAVPAREVQDPPRPVLEAPPPAYTK